MQPIDPTLAVAKLQGAVVLGMIRLPNRAAGYAMIFDNGLVLDMRAGMLYSKEESAEVIAAARARLMRQDADLTALGGQTARSSFLDAIADPVVAGEAEREEVRDKNRRTVVLEDRTAEIPE